VTSEKLDTACTIETPEGIRLELYPAGPVARGAAWLIDSLIRIGLYIGLALVLSILGATGTGILLVAVFFLEWFYPVYFELTRGTTPGKSAFGMIVVHSNGTPVGWQASVIRNLLRTVDFLPLFYGFGLVSMLLSKRFQRLGDMAADTLVVYKPAPRESVLIDSMAITPPAGLLPREQQALINFAERMERISESRSIELSDHLVSLTGEKGRQGVEKLLGYARWLANGR
jgi:uncharacterized RDD family membrane protein YckC